MKLSRRGWFGGLFALMAASLDGVGMTAVDQTPRTRPDDCCCIVEDGKLICTITGEVLEECCCR